ncbi:hypothetical protein [Streptomyces benahoarensis]|uniref:Uncharacterized protein n=1 Tax=Streptomyces benahoarensis TaxID=2595054 RepID=A0A553ZIQ9_9ACTN|nr:hypothetical protein [Streptomyces benahoarensis]TSB31889.1 hypothetical protein FNJ62_04305 [Streptomyces benahoarensis]TSB41323.1 hypothetical protein FNZ23_12680 [Streptomyces benahoarensis]
MYEPTTHSRQPLSEAQAAAEAARLIAEGYSTTGPTATSYKDIAPLPTTGDAVPCAQPGRPPMSQKATDASALMLSGSVAALSAGGATSLVLYTLGQVDPVTLAVGAAGPVALVLAAGSLLKSLGRAKHDMHTEHHHHYAGPVRQENTNLATTTKGLFARTNNTLGER